MELVMTGFRFFLGTTFLLASVPKLADPGEFRFAVANYELLPERWSAWIARVLPSLELLCALLLLSGVALPVVSAAAGVLLLAFASAVALNLLRGRSIDCGCSGANAPQQITWGLVVVDSALAGCAIVVAIVPPSVLTLAPTWTASQELGHASISAALGVLVAASTVVPGRALTVEGRRLYRLSRLLGHRIAEKDIL